jgi:integrase
MMLWQPISSRIQAYRLRLHPQLLWARYLGQAHQNYWPCISCRHQLSRCLGTVNRYLATVRAILRKACREWAWSDSYPALNMRREPFRRVRWITEVEAARLLTALPPHLSDMAEFALATGLRASNVRELVWSQVDLSRRIAWLYADQVKNNPDLTLPLNTTAIAVIRRRIGSHDTHVFSYRGKPLRNINADAWQRACTKAGISDFRWHDLRHTWASWHVQNGTSLQELMELGGWKSYRMVLRYAHLAGDHLRNAAGNITNSLRCAALPEVPAKEVNH